MDITYLPVPYSQVEVFTENKYSILITGEESVLFNSSVSTLVKAVVYDDAYYDAEDELDPDKQMFSFNMDIRYIRETRLQDVVAGEWEMSCGPDSLEEFLDHYDDTNPSTIVKVLALQPVNYDLKSLRKSLRTIRNK